MFLKINIICNQLICCQKNLAKKANHTGSNVLSMNIQTDAPDTMHNWYGRLWRDQITHTLFLILALTRKFIIKLVITQDFFSSLVIISRTDVTPPPSPLPHPLTSTLYACYSYGLKQSESKKWIWKQARKNDNKHPNEMPHWHIVMRTVVHMCIHGIWFLHNRLPLIIQNTVAHFTHMNKCRNDY